jgi:hypothetical protein
VGHVIVVRYADDMVVGFQCLADAHRSLAQLKQRLQAFAFELHPDKTRIIEFGRFAHPICGSDTPLRQYVGGAFKRSRLSCWEVAMNTLSAKLGVHTAWLMMSAGKRCRL